MVCETLMNNLSLHTVYNLPLKFRSRPFARIHLPENTFARMILPETVLTENFCPNAPETIWPKTLLPERKNIQRLKTRVMGSISSRINEIRVFFFNFPQDELS